MILTIVRRVVLVLLLLSAIWALGGALMIYSGLSSRHPNFSHLLLGIMIDFGPIVVVGTVAALLWRSRNSN